MYFHPKYSQLSVKLNMSCDVKLYEHRFCRNVVISPPVWSLMGLCGFITHVTYLQLLRGIPVMTPQSLPNYCNRSLDTVTHMHAHRMFIVHDLRPQVPLHDFSESNCFARPMPESFGAFYRSACRNFQHLIKIYSGIKSCRLWHLT